MSALRWIVPTERQDVASQHQEPFGLRDPQIGYSLLSSVRAGEGGVISGTHMVGLATTRRSILLHLPMHKFGGIADDELLI